MTATHTQMGPLTYRPATKKSHAIMFSGGNIAAVFKAIESDELGAMFADAPAAKLALDMICAGVAQLEKLSYGVSKSDLGIEFCFDGMRYSHRLSESWTGLITCIGWQRCLEALAAARGGE